MAGGAAASGEMLPLPSLLVPALVLVLHTEVAVGAVELMARASDPRRVGCGDCGGLEDGNRLVKNDLTESAIVVALQSRLEVGNGVVCYLAVWILGRRVATARHRGR